MKICQSDYFSLDYPITTQIYINITLPLFYSIRQGKTYFVFKSYNTLSFSNNLLRAIALSCSQFTFIKEPIFI